MRLPFKRRSFQCFVNRNNIGDDDDTNNKEDGENDGNKNNAAADDVKINVNYVNDTDI